MGINKNTTCLSKRRRAYIPNDRNTGADTALRRQYFGLLLICLVRPKNDKVSSGNKG